MKSVLSKINPVLAYIVFIIVVALSDIRIFYSIIQGELEFGRSILFNIAVVLSSLVLSWKVENINEKLIFILFAVKYLLYNVYNLQNDFLQLAATSIEILIDIFIIFFLNKLFKQVKIKGNNEDESKEVERKGTESLQGEKKKAPLPKNFILWLLLSVTISFILGFFIMTLIIRGE